MAKNLARVKSLSDKKRLKPKLSKPEPWSIPVSEWLEKTEEKQRWLVPGWILRGGLTLVSGTRKLTQKTYTSFLISGSMAGALHCPPFRPQKPSRVLYVLEEGAEGAMRDYFRSLKKAYPGLEKGFPNLHIAYRKRLKLNLAKSAQLLYEDVERVKPDIVVLDPLVYMISGDENKTSDMNDAISTLQEVMAKGCAIIVCHHLNNERGYKRTADVDQQVRGAGPLKDFYDTHIALRRYKEDEEEIKVTIRTRAGATRHETFWWEFEGGGEDGGPTTFAKLHTGPYEERRKTRQQEELENSTLVLEKNSLSDSENDSLENYSLTKKISYVNLDRDD